MRLLSTSAANRSTPLQAGIILEFHLFEANLDVLDDLSTSAERVTVEHGDHQARNPASRSQIVRICQAMAADLLQLGLF